MTVKSRCWLVTLTFNACYYTSFARFQTATVVVYEQIKTFVKETKDEFLSVKRVDSRAHAIAKRVFPIDLRSTYARFRYVVTQVLVSSIECFFLIAVGLKVIDNII